MLNSVIIVLRETLEASLLVSFLFVYSNIFGIKKIWMLWSVLVGSMLSAAIAFNLSEISEWYNGTGQELLFVAVLSVLSVLIIIANLVTINFRYFNTFLPKVMILFSVIIVLAVSLEGAEIIIYFESRLSVDEQFNSSLLGGLLGLGIGISVGAVSYYSLIIFKKQADKICLLLLSMVSAGMVSQAISYLMQAGMIDGGYPIWDSSIIVTEQSTVGQLLYALIGYEATPTLVQVVSYFIFLLIPLFLVIYYSYENSNRKI